ncbi:MAG: hypothetical protein P1V97_28410, partial [Planctomycetota bacterium]|nr:hypothetical protein [Planctomycetota bacterium]
KGKQAWEHSQKAKAYFEGLMKGGPIQLNDRIQLAACNGDLGVLSFRKKQLAKARKFQLTAQSMLSDILQRNKENSLAQSLLGRVYKDLALIDKAEEKPEDAEKQLAKSRKTLKDVIRQKPSQFQAKYHLVEALYESGQLFQSQDELIKAVSFYKEAKELCQALDKSPEKAFISNYLQDIERAMKLIISR